jgi:Protein of unknown function (DUF1631)
MDNQLGPIMLDQGLFGPGASKGISTALVPLTEKIVMQHLKHCRDLTRGFAYRVFPIFWRQWSKYILEYADKATSNKEQFNLFEVQRLLVAIQQPAEQEFCQNLSEYYLKFKNRSLNTLTGEERFAGDMLSLVENSDLEETIAITSITHRAESFFSEHLWSLQQRLALLNDGEKLDERNNPSSPVQFCEALRRVLSNVDLDVKTKIIGYKIFDQEVIGQLDSLYDEMNQYLIQQNLLPNLRFVPRQDSRRATDQPKEEETLDVNSVTEVANSGGNKNQAAANSRLLTGALSQKDALHQNTLLNSIRLLQAHIGQQTRILAADEKVVDVISAANYPAIVSQALPTADTTQLPSTDFEVYTSLQIVQVLDAMQLDLCSASAALRDYTISEAAVRPNKVDDISLQMMKRIADENKKGAVDPNDMQIIDLVGMLFEYMLSDEHLPNSVKALLSYLHTPFLKIAFIDTFLFEYPEHPARILLNNLAEAGVRWVGNDGNDQFDIFNKIKSTVFRLLAGFKNDALIFTELLIEFNGYTRHILRRQDLMEHRALEKVQGEEKLREAKIYVRQAVSSRIDGREIPSVILLLLLQPWSDYLSFLLLRYGENSESWRKAVTLIDDLLWSIETKKAHVDKVALLHKQDGLKLLLSQGFETIGYEQTKARKLVAAVMALQKMALQNRKAEMAPALMRSKLEAMAAEKAGYIVELEQAQTAEEAAIVEKLKTVENGTWFEFNGGKRLKLAWSNQRTNHYMLIEQLGKKVSLFTGPQLAREMTAGKAHVISGSSKPFFERALENIYRIYNARADHLEQALFHE